MKVLLTYVLVLFISFSAAAQQQETKDPITRKFYVGVDFNVTPYYLSYNATQYVPNRVPINFTAYPAVHLGYRLSKKASIQIGVAYASNRSQMGTEYNNAGIMEGNYDTIQTRGFIIPVTFRYNFLTISKRLQAYGTASLTTAYGKSTLKNTATRDGVITDTYKVNNSAVNLFLSLGLGLNYRINDRFNAFGEYSIINRNLTGGPYPNRRSLDIGLFNMGLNYKFK